MKNQDELLEGELLLVTGGATGEGGAGEESSPGRNPLLTIEVRPV